MSAVAHLSAAPCCRRGAPSRTAAAAASSPIVSAPRAVPAAYPLRRSRSIASVGASVVGAGRPRVLSASRSSSGTRATRGVQQIFASSDGAPVAIVTGGTRGIGLAIAKELGKQGCKLVINHVSNNGVEEAIAACKAAGAPEVINFQGDISVKDNVDAMMKKATDAFGRIDVVVNNAGITRDTLILRMKPEQWQQVIDVNLTGVFYCAQAAAKIMSKQRSGRIINITSVVGQLGNAGQANYSAAKGGVIAMTKTFAREFASRGVCVNAVAPGFIKSDMTAAIDPKYEGAILAQIPLGRMGEAEEVAGLVRYLAVDPSSKYITGHTFNVDGGMAM